MTNKKSSNAGGMPNTLSNLNLENFHLNLNDWRKTTIVRKLHECDYIGKGLTFGYLVSCGGITRFISYKIVLNQTEEENRRRPYFYIFNSFFYCFIANLKFKGHSQLLYRN